MTRQPAPLEAAAARRAAAVLSAIFVDRVPGDDELVSQILLSYTRDEHVSEGDLLVGCITVGTDLLLQLRATHNLDPMKLLAEVAGRYAVDP